MVVDGDSMKRFKPVLFIMVLLGSFGVFYFFESQIQKSAIGKIRSIFKLSCDFTAHSISLSYFQWSAMYEAFAENDEEIVEEYFEDMKTDFPMVESIEILEQKSDFTEEEPYRIISRNNHLYFLLGIFNDDLTRMIEDKVVSLKINPQVILDTLNLEPKLRISDNGGIEFVYGLKIEKLPLSYRMFFFSILSAVFAVLVSNYYDNSFRYKFLERLNFELDKKTQALQSIIDFTNDLLTGKLEASYQNILEKAIEVVPGAQVGSVLLKNNGYYRYVAAEGFDMEILSKARLKYEELVDNVEKRTVIIKNLGKINRKRLSEKNKKLMYSDPNVSRVKSTVSLPVRVGEEIVAFLNLDNLEKENAFDELSVEIAEFFASQIGVIFERLRLENELLEQKKFLEYLSYHDPLTNLANRRFLEEFVEKLIEEYRNNKGSFALVYIDLRKFKSVNDNFGHEIGDEVLSIIAKRLRNNVKSTDLVSRIGGDEFVIILKDLDERNVKNFIMRIIENIERPITIGGNIFNLSADAGIAIFPHDATEFGELLRSADFAMYIAKKSLKKCLTVKELKTI